MEAEGGSEAKVGLEEQKAPWSAQVTNGLQAKLILEGCGEGLEGLDGKIWRENGGMRQRTLGIGKGALAYQCEGAKKDEGPKEPVAHAAKGKGGKQKSPKVSLGA